MGWGLLGLDRSGRRDGRADYGNGKCDGKSQKCYSNFHTGFPSTCVKRGPCEVNLGEMPSISSSGAPAFLNGNLGSTRTTLFIFRHRDVLTRETRAEGRRGSDSLSAHGSLLVLYGDSANVRDSSTNNHGGDRCKQASRFAGLDGSGVLCGGRRRCRDSWSRGKYLKRSLRPVRR